MGTDVDLSALRRGRGCPECNQTGYRGRSGVYEFLQMTLPLIEALGVDDHSTFAQAARRQMDGNTLRRDAARMVLQGRTTVDEAMGVSVQIDE